MKAILEFTLPEEQHEFDAAINGGGYKAVIWEVYQRLRTVVKYECEGLPPETVAAYEDIRDFLFEELEVRNLDIFS